MWIPLDGSREVNNTALVHSRSVHRISFKIHHPPTQKSRIATDVLLFIAPAEVLSKNRFFHFRTCKAFLCNKDTHHVIGWCGRKLCTYFSTTSETLSYEMASPRPADNHKVGDGVVKYAQCKSALRQKSLRPIIHQLARFSLQAQTAKQQDDHF